jgi:hypothetical protein
LMRYSIEGSILERDGNELKACVAKRVAATLAPCNRTCFSGVLSDSYDDETSEASSLDDLVRKEHPTRRLLSSYTLEVNPVVVDPVEALKTSLEALRETAALSKAITAGGYGGAAPEALTGGSALQVEDVTKNKSLRSQGLAALRDWNRQEPFRDFLKSRMKDVSDSFIDHFVSLVDEFHLKKQEALELDLRQAVAGEKSLPQAAIHRVESLVKALKDATPPPAPTQPPAGLAPLKRETPEGAHKFRGQHVFPGEVEVTSGIYKGSKLHLLGQHEGNLYVKPQTESPDRSVNLQALPIVDAGKSYKINTPPRNYIAPELVHADEHGIADHTHTMDQKYLMHGIDLTKPAEGVPHDVQGLTASTSPHKVGWYQSAHGKVGYVKPDLPEHAWDWDQWDSPGDQRQLGIPEREALYHNLARDYFGMGAHVPTTALFTHPQTGEKMSVIERVPNAQHYDSDDDDIGYAVQQAGNNGSLDKLAMMDAVLGQYDRHEGNYMVTPEAPFVHHIDNGMVFNHNPQPQHKSQEPTYLNHYFKNSTLDDYYPNVRETPVHPEAAKWILGLNPDQLHQRLLTSKVPARFATASADKLRALQQLMWSENPTRGAMLDIGGR